MPVEGRRKKYYGGHGYHGSYNHHRRHHDDEEDEEHHYRRGYHHAHGGYRYGERPKYEEPPRNARSRGYNEYEEAPRQMGARGAKREPTTSRYQARASEQPSLSEKIDYIRDRMHKLEARMQNE